MRIQQFIVVEGKCDTAAIQRSVDADTIETNGSALSEETLRFIEKAHNERGVIVFTDPDYPGRRIRALIEERIPTVAHAFLSREAATPNYKGSLGIEHASSEAIQRALREVYTLGESAPQTVRKAFLIEKGLIGARDSKEKRHALGEALHIGETNGKTLLKRLNMFQITEREVEEMLKQLEEERNE